jgi:hypothetical protein
MHRSLMAQTSRRARSTGRNPSPTSPRPLTRPRRRISLQWAGRRCPQHLLWNAGGIPHLTITNSRKGRGARSFDTLRPLRLCVRLYWRWVSICTNAAWCVTDGVEPLTQLRLTRALVSLRNPLPQGERGSPGSPAGGECWRGFPVAGPSVSPSDCHLPIVNRWGGFGLLRLRQHPPSPRLRRTGRRALPSLLSQAWERDNARCSLPRPWRLAPACLRRQSRRP